MRMRFQKEAGVGQGRLQFVDLNVLFRAEVAGEPGTGEADFTFAWGDVEAGEDGTVPVVCPGHVSFPIQLPGVSHDPQD